jgi:hypothetical protein
MVGWCNVGLGFWLCVWMELGWRWSGVRLGSEMDGWGWSGVRLDCGMGWGGGEGSSGEW